VKKLHWIIPLAVLLCFTLSCQNKAEKAELEKFRTQATVVEQNTALVERLIDELNRGNAEIVKEMYAPDLKSYSPSGSTTPTSQNESFELTKAYFNAFPDLNQTIEELVASGDKVAIRFIARGTHKGDFQGIPATGNKMELSGTVILHIKDGKIIEERQDTDSLGFMMQLGMELRPKETEKK